MRLATWFRCFWTQRKAALAVAAALCCVLPLVYAQDKPPGYDDSRPARPPAEENWTQETHLIGEIGPGQFVINQTDFGVGRNSYGSLDLDGWAAYGRVAADQCGRRGFVGGHFNGHQSNGEFTLLCVKDGAEWRDASIAEIAATEWSFTDTNQVSWARANRAAERLCAAADRGFAGGHFNGHQSQGRYGLYCYGGSNARWFDATDAELAATGFGFATPGLDDVPWDQAMRAATGFCVGRGYTGGFMNGHQAPNRYGVVCHKSGAG
ncbi:hypothetical protein BH11PSE14_BH11PSE14_00990 [soil metagenome]